MRRTLANLITTFLLVLTFISCAGPQVDTVAGLVVVGVFFTWVLYIALRKCRYCGHPLHKRILYRPLHIAIYWPWLPGRCSNCSYTIEKL